MLGNKKRTFHKINANCKICVCQDKNSDIGDVFHFTKPRTESPEKRSPRFNDFISSCISFKSLNADSPNHFRTISEHTRQWRDLLKIIVINVELDSHPTCTN